MTGRGRDEWIEAKFTWQCKPKEWGTKQGPMGGVRTTAKQDQSSILSWLRQPEGCPQQTKGAEPWCGAGWGVASSAGQRDRAQSSMGQRSGIRKQSSLSHRAGKSGSILLGQGGFARVFICSLLDMYPSTREASKQEIALKLISKLTQESCKPFDAVLVLLQLLILLSSALS